MAVKRIPAIQAVEPSTNTFCVHRGAFAASPASIPWIHSDNANAFSDCLIFDKTSELIKVPCMQPLPISSSSTFSDVFDVLQHDNISSVEFFNDGFANNMIHTCLKPFLSAGQLFQMFLSRFCAFGLKNTSQTFIPIHGLFHGIWEELFFRGYCYRVDSDIDTDGFSVATEKSISTDISGDHDMQKHPMFTIIDKVSRINIPTKIFSVIFSNFDRDFYSAVDTTKRYFIFFEGKASCIISDCKKLLKFRLGAIFSKYRFQYFTSLVSAAAYKLCRKLKQFTNSSICCIMQHPFVADVLMISNICDYLSGLGVLLHGFKKSLVEWYLYFHRGNRFNHGNYYVVWRYKVFLPIPPLVKTSGILGEIL